MNEENTDGGRMNKESVNILVGKTITKVKQQAINCWKFEYKDKYGEQGHVFLWSEGDGPLGLAQLWSSTLE